MLALCVVAFGLVSDPPAIDGLFQDWTSGTLLSEDPAGDSTGPMDVVALRATSCGSTLFVQFDLANALNLPAGPASDARLRLNIDTDTGRRLTIDFRGRRAYTDNNTSAVVAWPTLNYASMPTAASTRFEIRADLSVIGAASGTTVTLQFAGSDALPAPVPIVLAGTPQPPARRSAGRPACGEFRVASFNTLFTGLIDPVRQGAFQRLLDAVDADIYCFQEEYDSTAPQVAAVLNAADPTDNGLPWNVVRGGSDLVIASQWPMIAFPMNATHFGAVVLPPGGIPTLIMTNHPACCGYIGSPEDETRIAQSQDAIARFAGFRNGNAGAALARYKDAPALLIGDWNLVGSTVPLDLWTQSPLPNLGRLRMARLIGTDASTWRALSGLGFWPGDLDLLAFDAARLTPRHQFILDSAALSGDELASLGLQPDDSSASDHLLLVADFSWTRSADFNRDGFVTGDDFDAFVIEFVAGNLAADFNHDGFVTGDDFDAFVEVFDLGC